MEDHSDFGRAEQAISQTKRSVSAMEAQRMVLEERAVISAVTACKGIKIKLGLLSDPMT